MRTLSETRRRTESDLEHEVSQVVFTVISASALLLGIWGAACLVSGLLANGVVQLAKNYLSAVTGF